MIPGERVVLRAIEDRDLERLRRWRNDPEMALWHCSAWPVSEEEQRCWHAGQAHRRDGKTFIVEVDDKPIGYTVSMGLDERSRSIEIGIHLVTDVRGKGYGKDAFLTQTRFCFEELNVHRVWLRVYAFNERAIGLYESMGFIREGQLRHSGFTRGKYEDIVLMSMLEDEFKERYGRRE